MVTFDVTNINSIGDFEFPVLVIPIELTVTAVMTNQKPPAVHPISLLRIAGEFSSPQHRVVARFQEEIGITATHPHIATPRHCRIEIPLDLQTVTKIEESRSGDLQCALSLRPLIAIHSPELNNGGAQSFSIGRMDVCAFNIPQSHWIRLLPHFGYGGLEILEVRYGSGVTAFQLPRSVQEIQLAKKYLRDHDWDKAVSQCRRAVEIILDSKQPSLPPQTVFRVRVETFIGDHLKGLNDRQARLLTEQMRMIWEVASEVTHANSTAPCKKADAEFIVRATMALVEYFDKLLS